MAIRTVIRSLLQARHISSLRTSIVTTLVVVLVLLAALLVYFVQQETERFRARASSDAMQYSREAAVGIDGFLSSTRYMLVTLSAQPVIKGQNPDVATPMLAELLQANPQYANIWATREDGWNYASALPPPEGKPIYIGDRQYFLDALRTGKMGIQSIPDSRQNPTKFAVVMAYPVRDETGRAHGTVNAAFELLPVQEVLGQMDLPAGTVITILDETGNVIARSEAPEQFVGRNAAGTKLWDTLQSESSGTFEGELLDGVVRLAGHSGTGAAPWQVLAGIPTSTVYAPLLDAVVRQLAILAIPIVAVAFLAVSLARTAIEKSEALAQRDIAEVEIKRLNEDLERRVVERTAELTAANKELEAFAYSISHDLRAPLRAVDGFSKLLLETYADRLDDEGKMFLRFQREGSQKMAQLIEDLLNLSRVTRSELRRERVDLSMLARSVAENLRKTQPERQVEILITPGLMAQGDPQLLRLVLENLLGNAWKFTSKHPAAKIEFGVTRHDGKSVYFVRDDGAGFEMEYADKLFGAFQRLHGEKEFPGTGIGLATAQRIIRRHGGQVWAEGQVEKGATFSFTL